MERKLRKQVLATSCFVGVIGVLAPTAAIGQSLDDLERRLLEQERQIQQQQVELDNLRALIEEQRAAEAAQAAEEAARDRVVVDYGSSPIPTFEYYPEGAADPKFTFKPLGWVQLDLDYVDPTEGETGEDLSTECRRCRLGFEGILFTDWGFILEVDFADNEVSIKDANIDYAGFDFADLTIGQFKTPNSLDELTSSR